MFYRIRELKDTLRYKLDDAKEFVVDKAEETKDFISDKTFDAKYLISDKASDMKDFIEDTAYFISDKAIDTKDLIYDKAVDAKYFVSDKAFDAQFYISEKVKNKSRADFVEMGSYILFPAQIPIKMVMSTVGKNSANLIQEKSDYLDLRINTLEKCQSDGKMLNETLTSQLDDVVKVKEKIHIQLEFFSTVLEKIHNRPTYNITFDGYESTFDELFRHGNVDSDFAIFDSYLLKIYDEDAGIIEGLMRSPVFAAILKFREKALKNKIDNALAEVNACIDNMKIVNGYLKDLSSIAEVFAKELHAVEQFFWNTVYDLSEIVDKKADFEDFTDEEITVLDTNIKLVRIIVSLLNTHLFEQRDPDVNGLVPVNKKGVEKVTMETRAALDTFE